MKLPSGTQERAKKTRAERPVDAFLRSIRQDLPPEKYDAVFGSQAINYLYAATKSHCAHWEEFEYSSRDSVQNTKAILRRHIESFGGISQGPFFSLFIDALEGAACTYFVLDIGLVDSHFIHQRLNLAVLGMNRTNINSEEHLKNFLEMLVDNYFSQTGRLRLMDAFVVCVTACNTFKGILEEFGLPHIHPLNEVLRNCLMQASGFNDIAINAFNPDFRAIVDQFRKSSSTSAALSYNELAAFILQLNEYNRGGLGYNGISMNEDDNTLINEMIHLFEPLKKLVRKLDQPGSASFSEMVECMEDVYSYFVTIRGIELADGQLHSLELCRPGIKIFVETLLRCIRNEVASFQYSAIANLATFLHPRLSTDIAEGGQSERLRETLTKILNSDIRSKLLRVT